MAATSVPLTLEEKEPVQVTEEAAESVILDGSIGENIGVAAITEETAAAYLDSFNFALDGEPDENFEDESGEPGDDIFESDVPDPETGEPASAGRKPMERRRSIKRQALKQQKIDDVVKLGQELLLQVTKGPRGTKGARVSTRVSLPGRYLVLMPEADNVGVSRKIEDGRERDPTHFAFCPFRVFVFSC